MGRPDAAEINAGLVRDVEAGDTNQIYWDTELRGFGLLVLPSGEKRYVIQYRAFGRSRRMTFRPGLTITDARKEAKAKLGDVAKAPSANYCSKARTFGLMV